MVAMRVCRRPIELVRCPFALLQVEALRARFSGSQADRIIAEKASSSAASSSTGGAPKAAAKSKGEAKPAAGKGDAKAKDKAEASKDGEKKEKKEKKEKVGLLRCVQSRSLDGCF